MLNNSVNLNKPQSYS